MEINGNQHYEADGTLKPSYQERHDLIEAAGWKLIEVPFSQCFRESSIEKFLNFDIPIDYKDIIIECKKISMERQKRIEDSKIPKVKGQKRKIEYDSHFEKIKNEIFKHDIDFTKIGWVKKVADVMKREPGTINKWMKRYHASFYNDVCFKKKVAIITHENVEKRKASREKRYNEYWDSRRGEVFNHGINFKAIGWIAQVERILDLPKKTGTAWMRKNYSEFYEKECFKVSLIK